MTSIILDNVTIQFPLLTSKAMSLTNSIAQLAVGGRFSESPRGPRELVALSNVSLEINDGDRVALIGHNGSGKSTLLRAIAGIYRPSYGTLTTQGRIGSLVDLLIGVNAEASGRENIFTRAALLGIPRREIASLYEEILDFSGLGPFIEMPIRTYSSGMLLRLAFSVATSVKSDILLMDEWLTVGDEDFVSKSEHRLDSMINNSKVLVLASHSRELIERLCTRAVWLENGQVKSIGDPVEICDAYFGKK